MADTNLKYANYSRRDFIKHIAIGGGVIAVFGNYGFRYYFNDDKTILKSIAVDFTKCTGCRTCETACSANNHKVEINGEFIKGLGDPHLSNIRVHHFNPDVDVPVTCALCPDTPCIEACPIPADKETGRKALYRHSELGTVVCDLEKCIGCTLCAQACEKERAGIIVPNPETKKPERMCTLCGGDPNCVKWCPYGALSLLEIKVNREFFAEKPEKIAELLMNKFYHVEAEVENGN
ncbi:MAG: 4Fe-4S dicluster domain-containing protein [Chlorobi bacterium]|nr:4Fe-4S dicluster domain-containing protein [Chlorobiota bacterium]